MTTPEPLGGGPQYPSPSYPPPPYQAPPPGAGAPFPPPPPYQPPGAKQLNVVGLLGLIVAAIGLIFACIPGALIVGWILLPIGFVLALVSLFLKGRGKLLGIIGLAVSVLGTIIGFAVFSFVVVSSFGSALAGGSAIVASPPAAVSPSPQDSASPAFGSQANPAPLGTKAIGTDWTIVINSVNQDGNAIVAAADPLNEAPPTGSHYVIVNWTTTYIGTAATGSPGETLVDVVTGSGTVIDTFDHVAILPDAMPGDDLASGASVTGSAAFLVPDDETFLVREQPGFLVEQGYFQP